MDTLKALADALNVTTDYLLGRTEDMQPTMDHERIRELLGFLREGDVIVIEKLCSYLVQRNRGIAEG